MTKIINFKLCLLLVCLVAVLECEGQNGPPPRTCGRNQVYMTCGPSCERECATLGQPCYRQYIRCPDGCYCVRGFARNAAQECIPVGECQK